MYSLLGSTPDSEGDKTDVGGGDTTVMTLGVVVGAGVLVVIFFVTLIVLSKRFKKGNLEAVVLICPKVSYFNIFKSYRLIRYFKEVYPLFDYCFFSPKDSRQTTSFS